MTTPTEKDAMALAVLEHSANLLDLLMEAEAEKNLRDARAHLAARIAGLSDDLAYCHEQMDAAWNMLQKVSPWSESNDMLWADEVGTGISTLADRATRAEAELAAVRANAERYVWLRGNGFGFAHDEEHRGISTMRWGDWAFDTEEGFASQADTAIDAARGGE